MEQDIKAITSKKLDEIYNGNIPKSVKERYNYELQTIFKNHFEDIYLLAYLVCKQIKDDGKVIFTRGAISSSLVNYLLNISYLDPINCNLSFETFAGIDGDREPYYYIGVPTNYRSKVEMYIYELANKLNLKDKLEDIKVVESSSLDLLEELQVKTGIAYHDIDINNFCNLELFIEKDTDIISEIKNDFAKKVIDKVEYIGGSDLIKTVAIIEGTNIWKNNIENIINEHKLIELPATREDVFFYLMSKGIDKKTAFEIMEFVRKGKASREIWKQEWNNYITIMRKYNVEKWYIEVLQKIKYMFPKAHCCNAIMINQYIMWYKIHYPTEFKKVIS